jgi:hypothetical protein
MKEGAKPAADPAHKVNWKPRVKRACKVACYWYDQTSHPTWQDLFDEICKRYGAGLDFYDRPDRLEIYEIIAMNVLVASKKRSQ